MTSLQAEHTTEPPPVDATTHVIAVVGIPLVSAAPSADGWFLSDFYLFNHLFRGLGKSQLWYTGIEPDTLVEKYGEFVHGSPFEPRRVVLDRDQRPHDIVVRPETTLRDDFLKGFRAILKEKWHVGDRILILAFAHGEPETFGLMVGFDELRREPVRLFPGDIRTTVAEAELEAWPHITLFSTSCYSGGWVQTSILRDDGNVSMTSAMTAAPSDSVSESQPRSVSGRFAGSMFTSAVVGQLLREADLPQRPAPDELRSYQRLVADIKFTLFNEIDVRFPTEPTFRAQGERWQDSFRHRSGFDSSLYQERYESLRLVPASDLRPFGDRSRPLDKITNAEVKA